MLYVRYGSTTGNMGTVFHLRWECADNREAHVYEVGSPKDVEHWRKTFGIRKICIKCRKAARRKG